LTLLAQFRIRLLVVILLSLIPLHADETKDLQKHLQERFLKKVLVIRNFYGGDHLVFDAQGKLVQGAEEDCWCAAQIQVKKLELKNGTLILRGPRVVGSYDPKEKKFTDLLRQSSDIEIEIATDPSRIDQEAILNVLGKVFLTTRDDLASLVPESKQNRPKDPSAGAVNTSGDPSPTTTPTTTLIKQGVSPPRATYSPDPDYTKKARAQKRQGNVLLWTVIDDKGIPRSITVVHCLGAGLDEAAVDAVSRWKFAPATKDGRPVAVQLNIEVTFHLY
jgi:TonB family protein